MKTLCNIGLICSLLVSFAILIMYIQPAAPHNGSWSFISVGIITLMFLLLFSIPIFIYNIIMVIISINRMDKTAIIVSITASVIISPVTLIAGLFYAHLK
jgi:hypothetical protein